MKECSAVSFSSSANLGPGFDTLAIAHTAFSDLVNISPSSGDRRIELKCEGLPEDTTSNTAGRAVEAMYKELGLRENVRITIEKGVPKGLGIGSSGSSAAAAVTALNSSLGLELTMDELSRFAMIGEAASSGTPHADNVSASIYGGLVFVSSTAPMKVHKMKIDSDLGILLIIPDIQREHKTRIAREAVPKVVTMSDHIQESRRLSLLLHGLQSGDRSIITESMNDDLVEKSRMHLFPFYPEIKRKSLENGAVGVAVSGAGPSIIEFTDQSTDTGSIISGVSAIFEALGTRVMFSRCQPAGGAYVT